MLGTTTMPKFSLKRMLGVVAAISVSAAAIVSVSNWWLTALNTVLVLLLCYSCTYVVIGGPKRACWTGFLVFLMVNAMTLYFPTRSGVGGPS
jgi:hypothetical protein